MVLGRWQATIVDEAGNVLPAAELTVRREAPGAPLAVLYADRDGLIPLGNPFNADAEGFAFFFAAGAAYRIDAAAGALSRIWRYVGIGTLQEADFEDLPEPEIPPATTEAAGAVELATVAEVRSAATGDKALVAAHIEAASASVALADAATVALDWDAGINFTLTLTANRVLGNPANGQPGTWRTVLVQGNSATDRTLTFGAQYLGELPVLTDIDNGRWYLLMLYCVGPAHFLVSAKRAL